MSTRCNVVIKGNKDVILYRHMDGYPEITGKELKSITKQARNEGHDADWVLNTLKNIMRKDYKGVERRRYEDTDSIHGDIDYLYTITSDLKVQTKKVQQMWNF